MKVRLTHSYLVYQDATCILTASETDAKDIPSIHLTPLVKPFTREVLFHWLNIWRVVADSFRLDGKVAVAALPTTKEAANLADAFGFVNVNGVYLYDLGD